MWCVNDCVCGGTAAAFWLRRWMGAAQGWGLGTVCSSSHPGSQSYRQKNKTKKAPHLKKTTKSDFNYDCRIYTIRLKWFYHLKYNRRYTERVNMYPVTVPERR